MMKAVAVARGSLIVLLVSFSCFFPGPTVMSAGVIDFAGEYVENGENRR